MFHTIDTLIGGLITYLFISAHLLTILKNYYIYKNCTFFVVGHNSEKKHNSWKYFIFKNINEIKNDLI